MNVLLSLTILLLFAVVSLVSVCTGRPPQLQTASETPSVPESQIPETLKNIVIAIHEPQTPNTKLLTLHSPDLSSRS